MEITLTCYLVTIGLIRFVYENHFYSYNPTTQELICKNLVKGSSSPCDHDGDVLDMLSQQKNTKW